MKRFILTIAAWATLCLSAAAQGNTIDISTLNNIGPKAILQKLGPEYAGCTWSEGDYQLFLRYPGGEYRDPDIAIGDPVYTLMDFFTTSPRFLFLTNYIRGGVKVGDPISKVKDVDFSATPYGKGDKRNNCRSFINSDNDLTYVVFGKNHQRICFIVKNDIITEIYLQWPETDELPKDYDFSVKMF